MSRRAILAVVAVAVLVIGVVVALPSIRVYTGVAPPYQSDIAVSPPAGGRVRQVLGVAHNAGNSAATTTRALRQGADVIEIDVITARGTLVAGRTQRWPWLAEHLFRGQSLARAWEHSAAARVVQLDLQQDDQRLLDSLVRFLAERPHRPVMVSSRDPAAIEYLRPRLPASVRLVLSVPFPQAVQRVRTDTSLARAIGGISVFHGLVDRDLVNWAHARHLVVFAWTVNDDEQLDELLRLGVDGISTDNLAILRALSS